MLFFALGFLPHSRGSALMQIAVGVGVATLATVVPLIFGGFGPHYFFCW